MPSFDDNNPFDPAGGSNNVFEGNYPRNTGNNGFGVNSGYDAEGNVGQAPMDFGPIDPRLAQSLVSQITNSAATQQGLPSLNAEAGSMAEDSGEDSRPRREPVTLFRYPPVVHVPTGVGRVRTSTLQPETRVDPTTIPTVAFTNESGNNQNGNTSENSGTEAQTSGPDQAFDSDSEKINWVDEDRFDLLLQIAYERRHETLSEAAWKRIANATHGGPFGNTSWNGVRLEFARLMRERFPGYGNETVEARERRENLDRVAASQENGTPSTVPASAIAHHVTDADDEQRERRQARQSEGRQSEGRQSEGRQSRRGRARGTTTSNRANGTRARGRQQRANGHAG